MNILYLEDDALEVMKLQAILNKKNLSANLTILENGELGMRWLSDNMHDLPDLILLDLNMPLMNGFEFLEKIKSNVVFRRIPVVIFTSSSNEKDVFNSYDLQAAGYFVKPYKVSEYNNLIEYISNYWQNSKTIRS